MHTERLIFGVVDHVAVMTLNRPEKLNSLDNELMAEIRSAFARINEDESIRALITTGNGRGWCTGADLAASAADMAPGMTPGKNLARRIDAHFNPIVRELSSLRVPTIAALNGIVAGGGVGYALAHDVVVGARSADFRLTFTPRLGVVPDMGTTWWLPRLIGPARAMGLASFGETLPAEKAEQWGLIWKCVDDGDLMRESHALARRFAHGSTAAFRKVREGFRRAHDHDFDTQLDWERDAQGELGDTPDCHEGVLAFLQKREPKFSGK